MNLVAEDIFLAHTSNLANKFKICYFNSEENPTLDVSEYYELIIIVSHYS